SSLTWIAQSGTSSRQGSQAISTWIVRPHRHRALASARDLNAHGDHHHRSPLVPMDIIERWLDSSSPWTWIRSTIASSLPLLLPLTPSLFITYTRTLHRHSIIILFSSLNEYLHLFATGFVPAPESAVSM
ncbi:hypothetical protein CF326_g9048, partial [Tilletia indica]